MQLVKIKTKREARVLIYPGTVVETDTECAKLLYRLGAIEYVKEEPVKETPVTEEAPKKKAAPKKTAAKKTKKAE